MYSECTTSDPITQADAVLEALNGSLGVGAEAAAVEVFNTAILSSFANQKGVSLSGPEGTELVLV